MDGSKRIAPSPVTFLQPPTFSNRLSDVSVDCKQFEMDYPVTFQLIPPLGKGELVG